MRGKALILFLIFPSRASFKIDRSFIGRVPVFLPSSYILWDSSDFKLHFLSCESTSAWCTICSDLRFNEYWQFNEREGGVSDEKNEPWCVDIMQERFDFLTSWIMLSSIGFQILQTKNNNNNNNNKPTKKNPLPLMFSSLWKKLHIKLSDNMN